MRALDHPSLKLIPADLEHPTEAEHAAAYAYGAPEGETWDELDERQKEYCRKANAVFWRLLVRCRDVGERIDTPEGIEDMHQMIQELRQHNPFSDLEPWR